MNYAIEGQGALVNEAGEESQFVAIVNLPLPEPLCILPSITAIHNYSPHAVV